MRITTEDGAGLDDDVKKLKGISQTVNMKVQEKNIKMSDIRLATAGQKEQSKRSGTMIVPVDIS